MPTSSDVARLAGVSRATVSAILNGKAREQRISPETEERVHAAAVELGYRSPHYARSLSTGKAKSIGFVSIGDDATAAQACFAGAASGCHAGDLLLSWAGVQADGQLVSIPHPDLHDLAGGIAECLSDRHDGLIVFCRDEGGLREAAAELLSDQRQLPSVMISDTDVTFPLVVRSDTASAWKSCLQHLRLHDHHLLLAALTRAADGDDIPLGGTCRIERCASDDEQAIASCLNDDHSGPSCLLLDDLSQAVEAARLLSFHQRMVPEHCSLICFAEAERAATALPAMGCIDRDWARCGQLAAELLLTRLLGDSGQRLVQRVHARFHPHASIGNAP